MKNLSKTLVTILAFGSAINSTYAQNDIGQKTGEDLATITTAAPFLIIGPDSRSGAMGDAGVAISPDANSIHWNPSKLAFVEDELELSLTYTPWLRNLVPDISLSYLSFYKKLNKFQTVGSSLRFFSLGDITFTDERGTKIRQFRPNEYAFDVAFAQKLSGQFSVGMSVRYVYSNLTGGISVGNAGSKPGRSFAVDLSAFYTKDDFEVGKKDAILAFGMNISNIGSKMSYTQTADQDFIPINLRIGPALTVEADEYNKFTFTIDANKLLVPSPAYYSIDTINGGQQVLYGRNPDVGIASAIFGSFNDAPGFIDANEQQIAGSVTTEELREINIAGGAEYWYADQLALRAGYFYEHATKGNRKYITIGGGIKFSKFSGDFSYLISANGQQNPLANTLRFTLRMNFASLKAADKGSVE